MLVIIYQGVFQSMVASGCFWRKVVPSVIIGAKEILMVMRNHKLMTFKHNGFQWENLVFQKAMHHIITNIVMTAIPLSAEKETYDVGNGFQYFEKEDVHPSRYCLMVFNQMFQCDMLMEAMQDVIDNRYHMVGIDEDIHCHTCVFEDALLIGNIFVRTVISAFAFQIPYLGPSPVVVGIRFVVMENELRVRMLDHIITQLGVVLSVDNHIKVVIPRDESAMAHGTQTCAGVDVIYNVELLAYTVKIQQHIEHAVLQSTHQ